MVYRLHILTMVQTRSTRNSNAKAKKTTTEPKKLGMAKFIPPKDSTSRLQVTTCIKNDGSCEDMQPQYHLSGQKFTAVIADGHCGTRTVDHIMEAFTSKPIDNPVDWIDTENLVCAEYHAGAMITVLTGKRLPDGTWACTFSWRGDSKGVCYNPDGTNVHTCDHNQTSCSEEELIALCDKHDICIDHNLKGQPSWLPTPTGQIAISHTGKTDKRFVCNKTYREIACFAVMGDNGSFMSVPTGHIEFIALPGSRIILASDGVWDVIHHDDPLLTSSSLSATTIAECASRRWTEEIKSIDLDLWHENKIVPRGTYPAGTMSPDDISVFLLEIKEG